MNEHRKVISLGIADLSNLCKDFNALEVAYQGYTSFKQVSIDRAAYRAAEIVMFTDSNGVTAILKNQYAHTGLVLPLPISGTYYPSF